MKGKCRVTDSSKLYAAKQKSYLYTKVLCPGRVLKELATSSSLTVHEKVPIICVKESDEQRQALSRDTL